MATKKYEMGFVLVLALILYCKGAMAQSGCSSMLTGLSSCISYVTGNSSAPVPSCCTSLANVVNSQPQCLCPLLINGAGSSLGIAINRTLALALPATCNVQTPQCNDIANGPASFPALSPLSPPTDASSEPPNSPTATTFPSIPSGSKIAPKTSGSTSAGTTVTMSIYLRVVTLFIAAWIANRFYF